MQPACCDNKPAEGLGGFKSQLRTLILISQQQGETVNKKQANRRGGHNKAQFTVNYI